MDDQIDVIEDEKTGTVGEGVKKEKDVEGEPSDSREAGNRLPGAEFFFEEGHLLQRSKVNRSTKVFWNGVVRVSDDGASMHAKAKFENRSTKRDQPR
jgi:hypothetical protein